MTLFNVLAALLVLQAAAQPAKHDNDPVEPFRIADNVYFVGASDIGAYLVTTPQGHILIDAGYESTVPLIVRSIEKLGLKVGDVKILLNTQAHFDHAGGFARMKQLTGARLMVSAPDAPVVEGGGRGDFLLTGPEWAFPPVHVDRVLHDGDTVQLGNMTLTARLTPGHTKGCTTWTFDARDGGPMRRVVVLCGVSILDGTNVKGMPTYPTIQSDWERTFSVLKRMPVDIFLGAHPSYFDGMHKAALLRANPDGPNPFVDPNGFRAFIDRAERRFKELLLK